MPFSPSSAGQKSNSSVNAVSIGYFNEHFSLSPTAQNAKESFLFLPFRVRGANDVSFVLYLFKNA